MVRKCEDAVKAQAKERQGTRTDLQNNIPLKSAGSDARDELAQMAGVSGKTYEHATAVLDNAPEPVVQADSPGSWCSSYDSSNTAQRT